jgi:hypothetical protein
LDDRRSEESRDDGALFLDELPHKARTVPLSANILRWSNEGAAEYQRVDLKANESEN